MITPKWTTRFGYRGLTYCYGIDMGADHVISRNLWLVWHNHLPWLGINNSLYFSPADWTRP